MDIKKLMLNGFKYEAVRVTNDNLQDVAEWCSGILENKKVRFSDGDIKIHYEYAKVGNWILTYNGFDFFIDINKNINSRYREIKGGE